MTSKKTHQNQAAIEASLLEFDELYEALAQNQLKKTNTPAIKDSNSFVDKNGLPVTQFDLKRR